MDEAAGAEAVTPTTAQQMRRDLDELSSQLGRVCRIVDAETTMDEESADLLERMQNGTEEVFI